MTVHSGIRDIPMAGIAFGSGPTVLRTTVGSCVAIAVYHRQSQVYGLAHAVLPRTHGPQSAEFADSAVALLVQHFAVRTIAVNELEAQLFGGAEMFSTTQGKVGIIGKLNIESARQEVTAVGITIKAHDVGSYFARRVTIACGTGLITCERIVTETAKG